MKNKLGILLFALIIFGSCSENSIDKQIVYMDTIKVFEQFEMKKDYDFKLEKDLANESNLLNTISSKLESAKKMNDTKTMDLLERDMEQAQQIFNEKFEALSSQYTTEVNKRLNEYLQSFGKEKKHLIILGATGQGNIMYVDKTANITEEVLKYANNKYSK